MSKCRGCGAEINWIRTRSGKLIPVDPQPVFFADGAGKEIVVTADGMISNGILCRGGNVPPGKRTGWKSHFATCPMADQFRRRGK